MKIIDKTVLDVHEPENTNVIWAEPVKKGINLHIFNDDKWNTVGKGGSDEEESSTEKEASTTIPLMDGIPSVGSELKYARGDHRHPSDTSKIDKIDTTGLGEGCIPVIDVATGNLKSSGESISNILEDVVVNGVISNQGTVNNFATCSTAAASEAKTASVTKGSMVYAPGVQVVVKFENKNTASNVTLNVDNKGAKEVHINGTAINAELHAGVLNNYVLLEYDGTYWNVVGPATTSSIVWDGGGTVFDQNKSLSGCLSQLNSSMEILTGRAIKTVAYDTTTHTITTTKVPSSSTAQNVVTAAQIVADGLTFDTTPTAGSTNPVTSAGIKAYVDNATPTITMDDTPTSGSNNAVKSSGIYNALQGKQNTLTFDSTPTASSSNPVTSGGVKTALDLKANQSTTYTKTEVDGLLEDVAILADDDGQATTLTFDPQADTVWNKAQTLGSSQQAQARNNIGAVGSVTVNGTTYTPTNGNVDLGTIGGSSGIETVKVNGTALVPDANKAVDVNTHDAVVNHGTNDTTFALTPNILHVWGEVTALTLTLATPTDSTIVNEYMFQFTSGSTATTLSLPSTVVWDNEKGDISIESGYIYQVSILNNIALWVRVAA